MPKVSIYFQLGLRKLLSQDLDLGWEAFQNVLKERKVSDISLYRENKSRDLAVTCLLIALLSNIPGDNRPLFTAVSWRSPKRVCVRKKSGDWGEREKKAKICETGELINLRGTHFFRKNNPFLFLSTEREQKKKPFVWTQKVPLSLQRRTNHA